MEVTRAMELTSAADDAISRRNQLPKKNEEKTLYDLQIVSFFPV